MGAGPTKIDYKERNFTEQPLEEEEIDILLQALPEENVINSIDNDGREKILRSMSDQKVFNIRGDNIFDYYLTNKREIIKGCMTSHIAGDETPCPDEKFNRMIKTIPDLVKRKQNLDTLALDSFLGNPEMYNKMLKEKISQKTLDIFTKDGDINIDVKETIEFKQFSQYFEMAYESKENSKKSVLPQLVESLKKKSPSVLEQFKTKDVANQLIGTGNLMIIYFFYVYLMMKIILQYNSTDKKRVPNETVYNSFSEFFNELGIEKQQFEYVLKFIAFNTFKKFMDYESKNDAKGLDIFLKDSLKILEEFIGKEYVNSLANFDFNTDITFDYVHTASGKPDMSVSEQMCKLYMESKGYGFKSVNLNMGQSGCIFASSNSDENKGFYNKASTNIKCSDRNPCVQKKPKVDHFQKFTVGKPDLSVSEFECEQYAKGKGLQWGGSNSWPDSDPKGCFYQIKDKKVYFNTGEGTISCSDKDNCIQKPIDTSKFRLNTNNKQNFRTVSEQQCQAYSRSTNRSFTSGNFGVADPSGCYSTQNGIFFNTNTSTESKCSGPYKCVHRPWKEEDYTIVSSGKPLSKYKDVSSGKPDMSVSETECNSSFPSATYTDKPSGCIKYGSNIRWNKHTNTNSCSSSTPCVQKDPRYLDEEDCNRYSNTGGKGYTEGMLKMNETQLKSFPKGCIRKDNTVGYSPSVNSPALCGHNGYNCIYKALTK